ncbi:cytochrome P450 [Mycena amicta]|nr:cytochrome P450 [Mycena amicta]
MDARSTMDASLPHLFSINSACISLVGLVVIGWFSGAWKRSLSREERIQSMIPVPASSSWIFGHMLELLIPTHFGENEFRWQKNYGAIYRLKGCFGQDRLMISDPLALQTVFNTQNFEHPPTMDNIIRLLEGPYSLSYVKGEVHKRFRGAMNVGFSASAVRLYESVFERVAQELSERMEAGTQASSLVDVILLLETATMSAISEVAFGISLSEMDKQLVQNYHDLALLGNTISPSSILSDAISAPLHAHLPGWFWRAIGRLPVQPFVMLRSTNALAMALGTKLVRSKVEAAQEMGIDEVKGDVYGRLLTSLKQGSMSADEIAGQTAVIMLAGQDTTSNALAFALLELARDPRFQDELRAEMQSSFHSGERLAYDNMPLLNSLIKEVLRFYPGVPLHERIAERDVLLPLKEPILSTSGEEIRAIPILKGQIVIASVCGYHRLSTRWGADADVFRPTRWVDGTVGNEADVVGVGPYANLAAFLGGGRTCIGWRFALLEMQTLLFTLVRGFRFSIPDVDKMGAGPSRVKALNLLMPVLPSGEKGLVLNVEKI